MPARRKRPQTQKPKSNVKAKRGNNGAEPRGPRYDRAKDRWK